MGLFASIPLRTNGTRIERTWFDTLRAAGVALETIVGPGAVGETSVSIANNQAATNVMGLVIDKTLYKFGVIDVAIRRLTSTAEVVAVGKLSLIYRDLSTAWELVETWDGDATGVTLTINASTGQVQYATDNMAGTGYAGTLKFKTSTFSI